MLMLMLFWLFTCPSHSSSTPGSDGGGRMGTAMLSMVILPSSWLAILPSMACAACLPARLAAEAAV